VELSINTVLTDPITINKYTATHKPLLRGMFFITELYNYNESRVPYYFANGGGAELTIAICIIFTTINPVWH